MLDLVAGSKSEEDQDYRKFVSQIGFDYRTDLDAAAVAFSRGNTYMALRGRFRWDKLRAYAQAEGGQCNRSTCYMPASQPGRYISFYALKSNVMALAVAPEANGVALIGPAQWNQPARISTDPVWISVPSFEFADAKAFPEGTHAFLTPLAQAQVITFSVGVAPNGGVNGPLEIHLDADCDSPDAATQVHRRLTAATDLLNKMIAREHMTPNPHGLSGLLVAGAFQLQDRRVTGRWPLDRKLVESLATGKAE